MSAVYLAEHQVSKQQRALKVLPRSKVADPSYFDRFYREGRAAASLNHSNVVRVHDIASDGDVHYLVMEYVPGQNIAQLVKEQGPLDFQTSLHYLQQAVAGLQHAHENQVIHRDVKPGNLLVTPAGDLKVLDLGLALVCDEETSLTELHGDHVFGTTDYLSPEQAMNSHRVDHRTDIYSLGCTLYFMLTGEPPFPKGSPAERIEMHRRQKPNPITTVRPDCPPALQDLCFKMMAKKPADRYQDCAALSQALNEFMATTSFAATETPTGTPEANLAPSIDSEVDHLERSQVEQIEKEHSAAQNPPDNRKINLDNAERQPIKSKSKAKVKEQQLKSTREVLSPQSAWGGAVPLPTQPQHSHETERDVVPHKGVSSHKENERRTKTKRTAPQKEFVAEKQGGAGHERRPREVGSQRGEAGNQQGEAGNQRGEAGNQKRETESKQRKVAGQQVGASQDKQNAFPGIVEQSGAKSSTVPVKIRAEQRRVLRGKKRAQSQWLAIGIVAVLILALMLCLAIIHWLTKRDLDRNQQVRNENQNAATAVTVIR